MLSFPSLYRFLGLVAVTVPAVVLACSTDVTPIGGTGTPAPTTTTTSPTDPTATPTSTATTPPTPTPTPTDAGIDAAQDSGPPPTDVAGSPECAAYCAKLKSMCGQTCIPTLDCQINIGQCTASTRDFLSCETTQGDWYCGADGVSIVSSCQPNTTLCK